MAKRPKFEEMNYPPEQSGGPSTVVYIVILGVIIVLGYLGYTYWWSCSDFGFFKFCSMVRKPV
jgi:flagellar basal body-associated protein FliL